MNDIDKVLAKMGLTEEEAMIFVNHFNHKFFEKTSLSLSLNSDTSYEYDNRYASISLGVELNDEEGKVLVSNTADCSMSVS